MSDLKSAAASTDAPDNGTPTRRTFVEIASFLLGGLVGLVPLCIGLFAFLDPLRRGRKLPAAAGTSGEGQEGFVRVTALDALPVGGEPQRFAVISNRSDAWNFAADQPVGAVYIQRMGEQDVRVFNATCPHAGCSVSLAGQAFRCPCHNSAFNLDGSKRVSESGRENPSPRPLDALRVDEDKLAAGEVWVEFMNFYTGREKPIPKI